MIGTIGVDALSIHTIPTQVITVAFTVPLGIGIALSIRIGNLLPHDVSKAKSIALWCWIFCAVMFSCLAVLCYMERHLVYGLFTTDERIIQGTEAIWIDVTMYMLNLFIFGVNMGIITGLGMQWTLAAITIFFLWIIGLPVAYYMAILKGGGLTVAWKCCWPIYGVMNIILMAIFMGRDWDEVSQKVRIREGLERAGGDSQPLLQPNDWDSASYESMPNGFDQSSRVDQD